MKGEKNEFPGYDKEEYKVEGREECLEGKLCLRLSNFLLSRKLHVLWLYNSCNFYLAVIACKQGFQFGTIFFKEYGDSVKKIAKELKYLKYSVHPHLLLNK